MKISLQNQKHQSIVIIAITLAMIAFSSTNFFKEQTTWGYLLAIIGVGTLFIAMIGAWFRKSWVQYCFFLPAIYSLLASVYSLLALTVRMCCNEHSADMAINIFIVLYIVALIYFATAYLARYFFVGYVSSQHNHFARFLLASGVATCAIAASIWSESLVHFMISDSQYERYNMAIFNILKSSNIAEEWWMLVISFPMLVLQALIVFVSVSLISRLVAAWTRWHSLMGTLYLCVLLFFVFGSQFLIGYFTGRGFKIMFFETFIRWGVILVSFFIAGMLATRKRESKY